MTIAYPEYVSELRYRTLKGLAPMDIPTLETHRHRAMTASGEISYLDVGEGRPAVFVHGILTNSLLCGRRTSSLQSRVLSGAASPSTCPVTAIRRPRQTPQMSRSPAWLDGSSEVYAITSVERFDLVANDTGGAVAQIVAAHQSDRLITFTHDQRRHRGQHAASVIHPGIDGRPHWIASPRRSFIARRRRLKLAGLTAGYPHPGLLPTEVVDAYYRPVFGTPESSRALARLVAALSSADLAAVRPQLARLAAPTLLVWGTGGACSSPSNGGSAYST